MGIKSVLIITLFFALQRTQLTVNDLCEVIPHENGGITLRNHLSHKCVHCSNNGFEWRWQGRSSGWVFAERAFFASEVKTRSCGACRQRN